MQVCRQNMTEITSTILSFLKEIEAEQQVDLLLEAKLMV
jgi:hypothetical protein